jgi:hypothetical protein
LLSFLAFFANLRPLPFAMSSSTSFPVSRTLLVVLVALLAALSLSLCAASPSHYQLGVVGESKVGPLRMIDIQVNSDADFSYQRHDWSLPVGCPIVAVIPGGDFDRKNDRFSERGWADSTTQLGQILAGWVGDSQGNP